MRQFFATVIALIPAIVIGTGSTTIAAKELSYKVRPTEFAYDIAITWNQNGRSFQLKGTPYYQVRFREKRTGLLVLGKLKCYELHNEQWRRDKGNDFWLGTQYELSANGSRSNAMIGRGADVFPGSVHNAIVQLIFPTLPNKSNDTKQTGLTLSEGTISGPPGTVGMHRGQSDSKIVAKAVSANRVLLLSTSRYTRDDGTKEIVSGGRGIFNKQLGLLVEHERNSMRDENDEKHEFTAKARIISDAKQIAAAKAQADKDSQALPPDMMPRLFLRTRLDGTAQYQRLTAAKAPSNNTIVAYWDSKYKAYFAAKVTGDVSNYELPIVILGSNEHRRVHIGHLARVPLPE